MFPRNENRNEGTFGCFPGTKTGTRVRSELRMFPRNENRNEGTFAKAALLRTTLSSPSDNRGDSPELIRANGFAEKPIFYDVRAIRANRLKPAIRRLLVPRSAIPKKGGSFRERANRPSKSVQCGASTMRELRGALNGQGWAGPPLGAHASAQHRLMGLLLPMILQAHVMTCLHADKPYQQQQEAWCQAQGAALLVVGTCMSCLLCKHSVWIFPHQGNI